MIDTVWRDIRYAVRQLARSRGFTAIAVLTLALGIGANTAIFSVVNAVLLRPLPYADPASLVLVREIRPDGSLNSVSFPNFTDWRAQGGVFRTMALFREQQFNVAGLTGPERISGALVSADFFRVLGREPALGRTFAGDEDRPGRDAVVVISHEVWQGRFGGATDVVGRVLRVDGKPMTVIGVAAAGFRLPEQANVWVPVSHDAADILENRGLHAYYVVGRLVPGVARPAAHATLGALAASLGREHPASNQGWSISVEALQASLVQEVRPSLLVLLGAVGFVLLIASTNVANMMLARATVRRRELSIRTALGASRGRLIRQLLTESVLLALLGGALGLMLAMWGVEALLALGPVGLLRGQQRILDGSVLGFTLATAAVTSLIFGLVPALHAVRQDPEAALRQDGRSAGGVERQRTRRVLVVAEIALSLLLLLGAGLMVRSFIRLQSVDAGFNAEGVVTARLSLSRGDADTARVIGFYRDLVERVRAIPGVTAGAAVSYLPLSREGARYRFNVEGQPPIAPQLRPGADFYVVTPGYFAALGIPLLRGRDLGPQDGWDAPAVVIINESIARQFWPGRSPIGQRLTFGEPSDDAWLTVVGVAPDVKQRSLTGESRPQVYAPHAQVGMEEMAVVARTGLDAAALGPAIRAIAKGLDAGVPVSEIRTLGDVRSASISSDRFRTLLVGTFALLALVLAAIGIYGVISYGVAQRSREIGIRMALGARPPEILKLVIGDGMLTVAVGVLVGVMAAAGLSRFLESLLYGVEPHDPTTFIGVTLLIGVVALAASVIPARRAVRVDPVVALRSE
ncbi:MAG: ABC transporter permease [Gemmatimonadota bacterium]|nr:ABC transporter permease [Gemmatimonadota bacterium]